MIKKITRHGNSRAVVIDRGVLDLLKIDDETPLDITTDGTRLIIEPIHDIERREAIEKALEKVHSRYGRMMKRLAG